MFTKLATAGKYLGQTARLMVGVPNYDIYLKHMARQHPDQKPMSYKEFYDNRVNARFGGNGTVRCC